MFSETTVRVEKTTDGVLVEGYNDRNMVAVLFPVIIVADFDRL